MPFKNIEDARKSRMKSYYKNRDKELARQKTYDKIRNHTHERKEYQKEWTATNPHSNKIASWEYQGIILREDEDWDSVFIQYTIQEECDDCSCKLTDDKKITSTRRCLEHDHTTHFIRGIVCHGCNMRRG